MIFEKWQVLVKKFWGNPKYLKKGIILIHIAEIGSINKSLLAVRGMLVGNRIVGFSERITWVI